MVKYQLWQSHNIRHIPVWRPVADAPLFDSPVVAADWGRAQNPGAFNTLSIWQVDDAPRGDGMAGVTEADVHAIVTGALVAGWEEEEEAKPTNKRGARR